MVVVTLVESRIRHYIRPVEVRPLLWQIGVLDRCVQKEQLPDTSL
jgi:hypothetical protein